MNNTHYTATDMAKNYLSNGYCPIPVNPKSKKPTETGWQNLRLNEHDLETYFTHENINIGIVLGNASNGLVDIDFDHKNAVRFGAYFLPETGSVFGRSSNKSSHWLYIVNDPKTTQRLATNDHGTIIELRGNGTQTVFPGSVHETGEEIHFEINESPAETKWNILEEAIKKIALATIIYEVWNKGNRHNLALSLSGFMATHGFNKESAKELIEAVAIEAEDDQLEDRLLSIETTFSAYQEGKTISWRNNLESLLGKSTINALERWFPPTYKFTEENSNISAFIDFSDAGLSDAFAAKYKNKLIWAGSEEAWYLLEDQIYKKIDPVIIQGLAKSFLQEYSRSKGNYSKDLLSKTRIDATTALSRNHLWIDPKRFNTDPDLLGLADGSILDLKSGYREIAPKSIVTKQCGVAFNPVAECPMFIRFLNHIFENNQAIIRYLQEAIGYSLTGSIKEQVVFILVGKGANGKSTLLNIIQRLMGDYATTTPMQTLMEQGKFGNQTNDLAALVGKRLVIASEGERDQRLAENKIKLMTGGDTIKARFMYGDYFEFQPNMKLWLATNNLPNISGSDDAIWRRLRIIDFPISIPAHEQDPDLLKNLEKELSGILNWALEGCLRWMKHGLQTPDKVIRSTSGLREENDVVGQWMTSCCITSNPTSSTSVKELYASYKTWCENSGLEALAINMFGKELGRKGFADKRSRAGNRKIGISLIATLDSVISGVNSFSDLFKNELEDV